MIYLDFESITANEGPLHQSPFFNYLINLISKSHENFSKKALQIPLRRKEKNCPQLGQEYIQELAMWHDSFMPKDFHILQKVMI